MKVTCVRAFGAFVPGDESEVPDGAAVSETYWQPGGAESDSAAPDGGGDPGTGSEVPQQGSDSDASEEDAK